MTRPRALPAIVLAGLLVALPALGCRDRAPAALAAESIPSDAERCGTGAAADTSALRCLGAARSITERGPVDLTGVAGLDALETLQVGEAGSSFGGVEVHGLGALARLPRLVDLELTVTGSAASLAPVAGAPGLRRLVVDTFPSSMSPPCEGVGWLAGLTALRELSLNTLEVCDLSALGGLSRLERLALRSARAKDLGALGRLTALTRLSIAEIAIEDLGPLGSLGALEELRLDLTCVRELGPLARLPGLKRLALRRTRVRDLASLGGHPGLEELEVVDQEIGGLAALASAPRLRRLVVNTVSDADLAALRAARPDLAIDSSPGEPLPNRICP